MEKLYNKVPPGCHYVSLIGAVLGTNVTVETHEKISWHMGG